jgi:superfamily II DNA/RNA helicase
MMPKQRRTGLFSATMPSTLKNFIKVGMRNPYYIEIHIPKGQSILTQWVDPTEHKRGFNIGRSVTIKNFEDATSNQIDSIQELPQNLSNFYQIVPNQSHKLGFLCGFLR